MKLLNFPLIKLTLCLMSGIVLAHFLNFSLQFSVFSLIFFMICLSICFMVERYRLEKTAIFAILTSVIFVGLGALSYQLHHHKNFDQHYTHHLTLSKDESEPITFRIREVLKSTSFHDKYVVDILHINGRSLRGKSILNVKKDALRSIFKVDDVFSTSATFSDINGALNPNQFDYKNYLEKQYIYHQISVDHHQLLPVSSKAHSVFGFAARLRHRINSKLVMYQFQPDERALINALLLGQRQDISPEIYDSYSKAGAIHILAISGLHVGIILLLLNTFLKPLEYLKHGKLIKTGLIVAILWSFAIVAGLSASVTRAVAMFSIVAIGMNLKRPTNIFNTLAMSMFFLLLFKPMFLFEVGFQMSYLAVISIVAFQPLFVRLYQPTFWPVKKLWQIFTVTLAAQLGVLPLSLFYFHQFPGLFFLSNLVIIPFLGVILGFGILIILLALIGNLPLWMAELYGNIISLMNKFIEWIAIQEQFVVTEISFSLLLMLSAYLFILSLFFLLKKLNFKKLSLLMISVLIIQSVLIVEKQQHQTSEFVVFHKNKQSLIGLKSHSKLQLWHSLEGKHLMGDPIIKNYKIGNSIKAIHQDSLQNLYILQNKLLLVIDSEGIYKVPQLHPNYILLRNSPKINLTRMLDSLNPELLIADGSNYKSAAMRWERSCQKQKIPFHWTSKKGALVLPLTTE